MNYQSINAPSALEAVRKAYYQSRPLGHFTKIVVSPNLYAALSAQARDVPTIPTQAPPLSKPRVTDCLGLTVIIDTMLTDYQFFFR